MSLNGLDNVKVAEAYRTALVDAGGWFLLKYVSRDEVELLSSGGGGVVEVRNAIKQYPDKSPLYGFIQYRRRKVLLKYVPDATSRLLKARVTVHFQSVTDSFTPHDTTFSLVTPEDLTETALSSACALHTASGSLTSSSSSLRRRRLNEITEDAAENSNTKENDEDGHDGKVVEEREDSNIAKGKSNTESSSKHDHTRQTPNEKPPDSATGPSKLSRPPTGRPTTAKAEEAAQQSNQKQLLDLFAQGTRERRQSSQSTRPSAQELDYVSRYKPKVKLGPRPSLDIRARPQTSGTISRESDIRPVSTLPAGVRTAPRKPGPIQRPQSQGATVSSQYQHQTSLRPPPVPALPMQPPSPSTSHRSRPVTPSARSNPPSPKPPGITPEKQRLMKALEMRKKQMAIAAHELERKAEAEKEAASKPATIPDPESVESHSNDLQPRAASEIPADTHTLQQNPIPPPIVQELPKSETPAAHIVQVTVSKEDDIHQNTSMVSPVSLPEAPDDQSSDGPSFTDDSEQTPQETTESTAATTSATKSSVTQSLEEPNLKSDSAVALSSAEGTQADGEVQLTSHDTASEQLSTPTVTVTDDHTTKSISPGRGLENAGGPTDPRNVADESTRPSTAGTGDDSQPETTERNKKRRGLVEPSRTISSETSEDNSLSDDEFIEELQSATVEQAKPIALGKSPVAAVFPWPAGDQTPNESSKTSRPGFALSTMSGNGAPSHESQRTVSGRSLPDSTSQGSPALMAKKINVSSGISSRIKALEMFSSRESTPNPRPQNVTPSSSSPFANIRSSLSRNTQKSSNTPKISDKSNAESNPSKTYPTPSPSPEVVRKSSQAERNPSTTSKSNPTMKTRAESISVTATIIRDPSDALIETPTNPSQRGPLNLHKSPLTVKRDNPSPNSSSLHSLKPHLNRRRFSLASAPESNRESTALMPKSEPEVNRMSLSSRSRPDLSFHRSSALSDTSSIGVSSIAEEREDKESRRESRRSRLLKRMSQLTSSKRRSLVLALNPQTTKQENLFESAPIMESEPEYEMTPAQMVDIGDVNVQFPDSLLWKRRFMRVDDQGYLVLDTSRIDDKKNQSKKYHLSEFRRPVIPDQEREELPHSILLDFLDGTSLQCACESRRGQLEILHTLEDAHKAYHQLYLPA